MGKGKGNSFERQICKQLSLWWSHGKDEDVFWRTASSGAMANVRSKKCKKSFGQYGDVQAINPIGQPLIDLFTIELKRGYSKSTFADLMEPSTHTNPKPCQYEKFNLQVLADYQRSDSISWLLIVKRDRRKAIILMPNIIHRELKKQGIRLRVPYFYLYYMLKNHGKIYIFGCTLDNFLIKVKPRHIKKLVEKFKKFKSKRFK